MLECHAYIRTLSFSGFLGAVRSIEELISSIIGRGNNILIGREIHCLIIMLLQTRKERLLEESKLSASFSFVTTKQEQSHHNNLYTERNN
jgi:hypothetical protein